MASVAIDWSIDYLLVFSFFRVFGWRPQNIKWKCSSENPNVSPEDIYIYIFFLRELTTLFLNGLYWCKMKKIRRTKKRDTVLVHVFFIYIPCPGRVRMTYTKNTNFHPYYWCSDAWEKWLSSLPKVFLVYLLAAYIQCLSPQTSFLDSLVSTLTHEEQMILIDILKSTRMSHKL